MKKLIFKAVLRFGLVITVVASNISHTAQNRYKIPGVPSWAMNKNCPVVTAISDANILMLLLNHLPSSSAIPIAEKKAKIIDGSLMLIIDKPKKLILSFCNKWYGKFVIVKVLWSKKLIASLFMADCISAVDKPPGR